MTGIFISFLLMCLAVAASSYLLPGVHVAGWTSVVLAALVLGVANAILKPILIILSLPLTIVTLGLFLIIINAAMVLLTASLVPGFSVDGWLWAIVFSIVLSIVSSILSAISK